jgi:hypothetical protein
MAALEFRILTNILMDQSLGEALKAGLVEDHFKDPDARMIYQYLYGHWFKPSTYKSVPTLGSIQRRFPSFQPTAEDPNEHGALRALINELKVSSFESNMRGLANAFYEWVDADPYEAAVKLKQAIDGALRGTAEAKTLDVDDIVDVAGKHYEDAKLGRIYGVPWPWEVLTEDTLGKRPGDFIVLYGRMKTMKTWCMLYCAAVDYMEHNCRVAIWSKEMAKEKLTLRMASLFAKVDYQLFKKGKLPKLLERRVKETFQQLRTVVRGDDGGVRIQGSRGDIMLMCGRDAPRTVEELKSTLTNFRPDVVYLDSFYHLDSARANSTQRWQRIAALAEDIKELAEELRVPIVAVHQANRLGEKTHGNTLADVADADVIAREADLIIRVLMKKGGRGLHEKGYEVAEEAEEDQPIQRLPKTGPRFTPRPVVRPGTLGDWAVTPKGFDPEPEPEPEPVISENVKRLREMDPGRTGAELALVLGGNREGTLEAFTIFAVPGYNFKVSNVNCTEEDIRKWVEKDSKPETPINVKNNTNKAATPKHSFSSDKPAVINKLKKSIS